MPEDVSQRDDRGRFLNGAKPGPGRPRGSRNKLAAEFIDGLYSDFVKHGPAVIEKVRIQRPDTYLKVIAALMPAKLEASLTVTHDLTEAYERAASYADAWRVLERARNRIGAEAPLIDLTPEAEIAWRSDE